MYIVLIGYLYVIFMIAVTMGSVLKGVIFFFFLGFLPAWLIFWLKRRGQLKRQEMAAEKQKGPQ
ncbi:hypothetical protein [Amantichitinum ursilacus]|uniref:Uncharacterized protein n=1 Tax=Amantichitinum ursilacus TaxID=857265 RepID=A0A0N1JRQ9_9NEIS|nr:hypothetical protein [Amantichitinum ursilacus]KPC50255.1 hypothetical protein WG78_17825 [Amantichitinum ursilacus]